MKYIIHNSQNSQNGDLLCIETALATIKIRSGLKDAEGTPVETVTFHPRENSEILGHKTIIIIKNEENI